MKTLIGGAFDLIHTGHIFRINTAKALGDYLVVNITPDNRVKRKKGVERPIQSGRERMTIVNNIKGVNEVVSIEEEVEQDRDKYEIECLKKIKPNIFITNSCTKKLKEFCNDNDVELLIWDDFLGLDKMHTTDIINKIL